VLTAGKKGGKVAFFGKGHLQLKGRERRGDDVGYRIFLKKKREESLL